MKFRMFLSVISTFGAMLGAMAQTAEFEKVWCDYAATHDGKQGMTIHSAFSVSGMKGREISVIAFFYDSDRESLKSNGYPGYKTSSGTVCAWKDTTVPYESASYRDYSVFIPYEALSLAPGEHTYYFRVYVRDDAGGSRVLGNSEWQSFSGTGSNTQRKYYGNGTYADITDNGDGTVTTVTYSPCTICHGRKRCNLCQGQGGRLGGYGNYRRYTICTSCGGDGRCKYCMGSGMNVFTSTYHSGTQTTVGKDLFTGKTYVSGSGGSRSERDGSDEEVRSTLPMHPNGEPLCPDCKGSGKCHICQGKRVYYNRHCSSYVECSYCRETGTCPMCHGRGSIR